MKHYTRFAIYYAPPQGALAQFGAQWLGWDAAAGALVDHPDIPHLPRPLSELTRRPRKYGFHGTLKPPFRLANGTTPDALSDALGTLTARLEPVVADGLVLRRIGSFLALVPNGPATSLAHLAATLVQETDGFRAPPTSDELDKRRAQRLSPVQLQLLEQWGYPYVLDQFCFHMTLTGRLRPDEDMAVQTAVQEALPPLLDPFLIREVCLFAERTDGYFEILKRYPLGA
ncbi:MAG: DUF1045 domain-containing protein [Paracoccaceae bacterium]